MHSTLKQLMAVGMTQKTSDWSHSHLKPLSANQAFCGKKVKTSAYRKYEMQLLRTLPALEIPDGELELRVVVYYSNKQSDIDNCLKPFIDILQKRYGFNDNRIYRIRITKVVVPKGQDNMAYRFYPFTPNGNSTHGNETTTDE
jgi:Holliday junction resolvase RusA-like endonuclease